MLSSPSSFILGTEEWSHIHSCFRWAFPACHWHLLPVNAAVSALHCVLCRAELPSLKARLPGQQRRMPVWIKAPGSAISKGGGGAASWSSWADIFEVNEGETKHAPKMCQGNAVLLCESARTLLLTSTSCTDSEILITLAVVACWEHWALISNCCSAIAPKY